jgi:ferredoxin
MTMDFEQEMENRANAYSDFTDLEELCANCGECYACHETKPWMGTVATVCPSGKGFFALPEAEE